MNKVFRERERERERERFGVKFGKAKKGNAGGSAERCVSYASSRHAGRSDTQKFEVHVGVGVHENKCASQVVEPPFTGSSGGIVESAHALLKRIISHKGA